MPESVLLKLIDPCDAHPRRLHFEPTLQKRLLRRGHDNHLVNPRLGGLVYNPRYRRPRPYGKHLLRDELGERGEPRSMSRSWYQRLHFPISFPLKYAIVFSSSSRSGAFGSKPSWSLAGAMSDLRRRKQGNPALGPYQCVDNQLNILSFVAAKAHIAAFQATTVFYHFPSAIVNSLCEKSSQKGGQSLRRVNER